MNTPQFYRDPLPAGRRRLLVVDDDPSLRLLLRETPAADEFEIEEVASAEETREVARFRRPAVVLLDVQFPGLEVSRSAGSSRPAPIHRSSSCSPERQRLRQMQRRLAPARSCTSRSVRWICSR
jgi:DNA-binding response OmpR family regulator